MDHPNFFYTILCYPKIGWKVRVFFAILFIIPTALFLPVFITIGVVAGFIYSIAFTVDVTMDTTKNPFCGMCEGMKDLADGLKDTTRSMNEALRELSEIRNATLPPGDVPWDVAWSDIIGCSLSFVLALGFMFPMWMLIVILKFLPWTVRLYIEFWRSFCSGYHGCIGWFCFGFLFLIGNILLPLISLASIVICMFHGLLCCFYAIYVCYDYTFFGTLKYMCATLHRYDGHTHHVIMGGWGSNHDAPVKSIFDVCHCCDIDSETNAYAESVINLI